MKQQKEQAASPRRPGMRVTFGRPVGVFLIAAFFLCAATPVVAQQSPQKAWTILKSGLEEKDVARRAEAVRVLGLLEKNAQAAQLALAALDDEKPEVRAAAADALGQMKAASAAPRLVELVKSEKEVAVVMAAARSLIALRNPLGYAVYYAVLTGERKTGDALLEEQKKMLKDPKKMAQFGFEQGIGFVPFASVGFAVLKGATRDDSSPVRAAAAKILAKDPDPKSAQALIEAAADKSWIVRAAALDALAHRGDPALLPQIEPRLEDGNDAVRYTAAAAIIHLHDVPAGSRGN